MDIQPIAAQTSKLRFFISLVVEQKVNNEKEVCRFFRHTTKHGAIEGKTQSKKVKYYNLDVIISVGYRVKSPQATNGRLMKMYDWIQKLDDFLTNKRKSSSD